MPNNLFGQIVTPGMVERAVAASISEWIDTYLAEIERLEQYDPGVIQRPLDVINASEFEKWPEDQIPVVLVMNTGLAGNPVRRTEGRWDASWLIGVSPVVSDTDHASSRALAMAYIAALRVGLMQHRKLRSSMYPNGFSTAVRWRGEDYTDLQFGATRTLGTAHCILEVLVENVMTDQGGPRSVLPNPTADPGNWPPIRIVQPNVIPLSPLETVS